MNTKQITYVPASQPGPHYIESGMRPRIPEHQYSVIVAIQEGITVSAAIYRPEQDQFVSIYTDRTYRPVCWWPLPAAVANTEREWFDEVGPQKGYEIAFRVSGGVTEPTEHEYQFCFADQKGAWLSNADEAIDQAYHHWVAAGRP